MNTQEKINEMVNSFTERKPTKVIARQDSTDYESKENVRLILECRAEIDRINAENGTTTRIPMEKFFDMIQSGQRNAFYEDVQTNKRALGTTKSEFGIS